MYRIINSRPKTVINYFCQDKLSLLNLNVIARSFTKKSSKTIRKEFLDYFQSLDHKFLRSSRVVPIFDPSVAFTNAGMNQFKKIFLGEISPPYPRVANHQKCVRIGGKHNDLAQVGYDNYHHTFFEMLGSWSFNNYGRREACSYALELLTGPFNIPKDRIFVTYFAGDDSLPNLPKDYETLDTWRSLDIPDDRILPQGLESNFWEMGVTGPCGTCTEIHISPNAPGIENPLAALRELWNIVFIEYNRLPDGNIIPLQHRHVDTGMGFERLVAVLQGKSSNYDTDLFSPIFKGIHHISKAPRTYEGRFGDHDDGLDTAYRIVADHARMVAVCLADGMVPEEDHKIRRIVRRAITIGNDVFKKDQLLAETCNYVADTLGEVYPEINDNLTHIKAIINHEEELIKKLRLTSGRDWERLVAERPILKKISNPYVSGLVAGYKDFQEAIKHLETKEIPGKLSYKLYDTYGLDMDLIKELAEIENLVFDKKAFDEWAKKAQLQSRIGLNKGSIVWRDISDKTIEQLKNIKMTDDSLKYAYKSDEGIYKFPEVNAEVLGILVNGDLFERFSFTFDKSLQDIEVGLILDKTPFYTTEGGQYFDQGSISIENIKFKITDVRKMENHVIHFGKIDPSCNSLYYEDEKTLKLSIGECAKVNLDDNVRLAIMRHHTATHLLNAALRIIFPAIAQRGSLVKEDNLTFQFSAYGKEITKNDIDCIEKLVNDCIEAKLPVTTRIVDTFGFTNERGLVLVPGIIYPETKLRIVEIDGKTLKSKELCCGTHVFNTGDLNYFKIKEVTQKGSSSRVIKAVVGAQDRNIDNNVIEKSKNLKKAKDFNGKELYRKMIQDFMACEIKHAIEQAKDNYIVYRISVSSIDIEHLPLHLIEQFCEGKPIFVMIQAKKKIRMKCSVPQEFVTAEFNAELWMKNVNKILKSQLSSFDGQNPLLTSHIKIIKLPLSVIKETVKECLEAAENFAKQHCKHEKIVTLSN